MTAFADLAEPILRNAKILDQLKADLFDIFHDAPNAHSLARKLQSVAISGNLKDQLVTAKRKSFGSGSNENLERAIDAIKRLQKMDPRVLELAEKSPTITAALVDAARRKARFGVSSMKGNRPSKRCCVHGCEQPIWQYGRCKLHFASLDPQMFAKLKGMNRAQRQIEFVKLSQPDRPKWTYENPDGERELMEKYGQNEERPSEASENKQ